MKLENQIKTKVIKINGEDVTVSSYLSTIEKNTLIEVSLANAMSTATGNLQRLAYDASIYTLIALRYSDIKIEDMDKMTLCDVYDLLETNGILVKILNVIEELSHNETKELIAYADEAYSYTVKKLNSSASGIESAIGALLQMSEEAGLKMAQAVQEKTTE